MSTAACALAARAAWARVGAVLIAVLVVDQVVKQIVNSAVDRGQEETIAGGFKIVNARNTGVAFGQLQDGGVILTLVIVVAIVGLLVFFARQATRRWMWLPTGLLLGGALGNIADRVREGAVVDFIKLPHWPAFNLADASITIGVVVLLLVMDRGDGARRSS
ncbi:MAG: signal peptidase [Solirubrobacteraceae bacterium]|nr:signal peptidase [Solirubrobacteraceae bacterium]